MAQKMQISDILVDKYKKLLYLKKVFKKVFCNFLEILAKKCLGSVFLSRDGWVTPNIRIIFLVLGDTCSKS